MAWPNDARYVNYAANQQIKSSELNEFQDQIFANHANIDDIRDTKYTAFGNMIENAAGNSGQWNYYFGTNGGEWKPNDSGDIAYFEIPLPSGADISYIEAKAYNSTGGVVTWTMDAYLVTNNFDVPATAPSAGTSLLGSGSGVTADIGATSWAIISGPVAAGLVLQDERLIVMIDGAASGNDAIAAVRVTFKMFG